MKPVLYVVVNRNLSMSPGKLAAQVAHATVGAICHTSSEMLDTWETSAQRWAIILEAQDEVHLGALSFYLDERGYGHYLVCDEGANEVRPFSYTALGVPIVDKDDPEVKAIFGLLPLHQGAPQPVDLKTAYNTVGAFGHLNRKGKQQREGLIKK